MSNVSYNNRFISRITIGITRSVLMFHILSISLLSPWYFSTFSFSFSPIRLSPGTAVSTIAHFLSCLFTTTMSGVLASMTWSRWMFISHSSLTSLFSLTLSGTWSYYLSFFSKWYFSHNFQRTTFAPVACLFLHSLLGQFFTLTDKYGLHSHLSRHITYIRGIPSSSQYGISYIVDPENLFLACTNKYFCFVLQVCFS